MFNQKCKYCGDEYQSRMQKSDVCIKKECQRLKNREYYKNTKVKRICKHCKNEYLGTAKSTNCPDCSNIRSEYRITIKRDLLCRDCDNKIGEYEVKIAPSEKDKKSKPRHGKIVCEECKQKSSQRQSDRMKGENNPMWVGGEEFHKHRYNLKPKEQWMKEVSERMKKNNPMFQRDIRNKVSKTLKNKIKNGDLIYDKGENHHRWKGNRIRSQTIRTRLYKLWAFEILKKNNFTCEICKSKKKLEIHHSGEPFRDILEKVLHGRVLNDLIYEDFEKVSDEVIDYHIKNNVEGQCLCKKCHKEIDEYRK